MKAEEEKATEQLSKQMKEKMDSTQQQAVEATQLAVQAQSVAQFATSTMTEYEKQMSDISQKVVSLQQLVIDERKRRMTMESQLSSAQDKIGAAEWQSRDLTMKNQQLTSEVASWKTAFNMQQMAQSIPVASSSTIPQMQPALQPQMQGPQKLPLNVQTESHPQGVPTSLPLQREPSLRNRHSDKDVFLLVPCLMRPLDTMEEMEDTIMEMI